MRNLFSIVIVLAVGVSASLAQAPAAIEAQMLAQLQTIAANGTYGGEFDEGKLDRANEALKKILLNNGTRPEILKYPFPKLKGEMQIATSRDGRLRIYSWDLETGGTMHDFANVYQYQTNSGAVKAKAPDEDDDAAGSFYTEIFQVNSKSGTVYLPVGTFIGSSSLNGQSISTMRIDKEELVTDASLLRTPGGLKSSISFSYDLFSVVDRPERPIKLFQFDEKRQEFRFPIVIEDQETPQGRVTNKYITYRFDGEYFAKVK